MPYTVLELTLVLYDYFTNAIVGDEGKSRGDFTASEDDNILVQGIASDVNALGFFGYAYYVQNKEKLKLVAVDGGPGLCRTVSRNDFQWYIQALVSS